MHDYHVLTEVNLDPKAESATMDLQVDPGRTIALTLVDPEGQPVGGTRVSGLIDMFSTIEYEQDSATIEVHALVPSKPRRVRITHAGRKLAGSVYLKGDEIGPLTVRLQPCGIITGRVVDDDRLPRGPLSLHSLIGFFPESSHRSGHPAEWSHGAGHPDRPRRPVPRRGTGPGPQVRSVGPDGESIPGQRVPRRDPRARRGEGSRRPEADPAQAGWRVVSPGRRSATPDAPDLGTIRFSRKMEIPRRAGPS